MGLYPVAVVVQEDTTHKVTHVTQDNPQHSNNNTAHKITKSVKRAHTIKTQRTIKTQSNRNLEDVAKLHSNLVINFILT
jgi:hypothetical protein